MVKTSQRKTGKQNNKLKKTTAPVRTWMDDANEFIDRHSNKVILFLFLLSLALSAVYYIQARHSPVISFHKWVNSDMAFFDSWAQQIANGDWWGKEPLHPFHDWHDGFAEEYFNQYPEVKEKYASLVTDPSNNQVAKRALINDVYKGRTFHQEPFYAYMLAVFYSIFGVNQHPVYFLQFLLAAFTSVFIFLIGKKSFGPLAGVLSSLFFTLCGSVMVFQMVLLRTTMTNFLTVLLLAMYLWLLEKPDWKKSLLFGAASAIALLTQFYFILFLIPAWAWLIWKERNKIKDTSLNLAAFLGALIVVMSPLFIRNIKMDVPFAATASHGAMAYIPANTQLASTKESFFLHMPTLVRIRHESNGKIFPAAILSMKTFENIGAFWKVYKQKLSGLFMWYEVPNNMNYYMYRHFAPILGWLPVRYYFIAPLGLAGLAIGMWNYRSKLFPLILMTVISIAPLIIAGNFARYRTPLVMMMCIFAAYFMIQVIAYLFYKKWKHFTIGIAIAIIAFLFTTLSVEKSIFVYNSSDIGTFYQVHYQDRLAELQAAGDMEGFLGLTTEVMNYIPPYFFRVSEGKRILKNNEAESSHVVIQLMQHHLNTLQSLNRIKEVNFYKERIQVLTNRMNEFNARSK